MKESFTPPTKKTPLQQNTTPHKPTWKANDKLGVVVEKSHGAVGPAREPLLRAVVHGEAGLQSIELAQLLALEDLVAPAVQLEHDVAQRRAKRLR